MKTRERERITNREQTIENRKTWNANKGSEKNGMKGKSCRAKS